MDEFEFDTLKGGKETGPAALSLRPFRLRFSVFPRTGARGVFRRVLISVLCRTEIKNRCETIACRPFLSSFPPIIVLTRKAPPPPHYCLGSCTLNERGQRPYEGILYKSFFLSPFPVPSSGRNKRFLNGSDFLLLRGLR